MDFDAVPAALRGRLGTEATGGLLTVLETARHEWSTDVISLAMERFDRRFSEELSTLRVEFARSLAAVRVHLHADIAKSEASVRQEIVALREDLGKDILAGRFELVKWSFVFWVGQVVAVAAVVGVMLQLTRP